MRCILWQTSSSACIFDSRAASQGSTKFSLSREQLVVHGASAVLHKARSASTLYKFRGYGPSLAIVAKRRWAEADEPHPTRRHRAAEHRDVSNAGVDIPVPDWTGLAVAGPRLLNPSRIIHRDVESLISVTRCGDRLVKTFIEFGPIAASTAPKPPRYFGHTFMQFTGAGWRHPTPTAGCQGWQPSRLPS
jgi:hypothetical protein